MNEAEKEILPFEEFEQLPKEKKIAYLSEWIRKYKVKGVIKQWNLKYPPDYYIRLKKLGIYQEIVGKNRMRGRSESRRLNQDHAPDSQPFESSLIAARTASNRMSNSSSLINDRSSLSNASYVQARSETPPPVSTSIGSGQNKRISRKRPAGIIRKIDELGRVVIPQETRSMLGISIFDALEVYTDDETEEIMVKKYSPGCIHCHSFDELVTIKQKQICRSCLQEILQEAHAKKTTPLTEDGAPDIHDTGDV